MEGPGSRPKGCRPVQSRTFFVFFHWDCSLDLDTIFFFFCLTFVTVLGSEEGRLVKNFMLAAPCEYEYILCGFSHYLPGTITCGGHHKAGG